MWFHFPVIIFFVISKHNARLQALDLQLKKKEGESVSHFCSRLEACCHRPLLLTSTRSAAAASTADSSIRSVHVCMSSLKNLQIYSPCKQ
jgi:hypothetical protein